MKQQNFPHADFKYSLDFLKRFNSLQFEGKPLSHQKIFQNYNVWIFFQTRLFFNDIKSFSESRLFLVKKKNTFRIEIQNIFLSSFAFIVSVLSIFVAVIKRKKVFVYGIDKTNSSVFSNDSRLDSVYENLKKRDISFLEIFHTTFDRTLVQNAFRRKRLAFYLKSIDFLYPALLFLGFTKSTERNIENIDFSSFSKDEIDFAKSLVQRYLGTIDKVEFRVRVLQKIIKVFRPKMILLIDNTRDYWELVLATKLAGVSCYAFQHGHFTKYHVGWLGDSTFEGIIIKPDTLFVWSDFWKGELIRLKTYFTEDSIKVGGFKNKILKNTQKNISLDDKNISVLIPFEVDSNKSEVKVYIDTLLACRDIKIFFKVRTDVDKKWQLDCYQIGENYHKNLIIISSIEKYLEEIDVVVGTYSTFLYDMIAYEKPIAILKTESDFGEGLIINGFAEAVEVDSLCNSIKKIAKTDSETLVKRKERLFGKDPLLLYDTVDSLMRSSGL